MTEKIIQINGDDVFIDGVKATPSQEREHYIFRGVHKINRFDDKWSELREYTGKQTLGALQHGLEIFYEWQASEEGQKGIGAPNMMAFAWAAMQKFEDDIKK